MFPVFSLVLDQDVKPEMAMLYPELYKDLTKVRYGHPGRAGRSLCGRAPGGRVPFPGGFCVVCSPHFQTFFTSSYF